MISHYTNLFKRSDYDLRRNFRTSVINLLREKFPQLTFSETDDVEVVRSGPVALGLSNLYAKFLQTAQTNCDLADLVAEHFSGLIEVAETHQRDREATFADIQDRLLPQLIPRGYADRLNLVTKPFGHDVVIGFVLDGEQTYSYVVGDQMTRWNLALDEAVDVAYHNLEQRSGSLEMTFVPPPNGLVVIATGDGFDATRIVLPKVRDFCREHLGARYWFGIPNRDFLVCWSNNGDAEFHGRITGQIGADFRTRPYALCDQPFTVDSNGSVKAHIRDISRAPNWMSMN